MRILYHHRTQAEDAQGIHIQEIVRAFQKLGHHVDIVSLVKHDNGKKTDEKSGLKRAILKHIPSWLYEIMSLLYNIYGYGLLSRQLKTKKYDMVYERYSLNTFCGIWASQRYKIPMVLEVNAPLYYEQCKLGKLTFKRIAHFSERWICSNSTKTIVVSNVMKDFMIEEGVLENKIVVMRNGIDPVKFNPKISGESVLKRYGLETNQVIGFVGWFRKWHGLEMLLKVMNEAKLGQKGVRLLLVGDGPSYNELSEYVARHNLESVVTFTGPVSREAVAFHIAAMDIVVQPSATEYACPIKIMEYMGMGKCIVAADQPNIKEVLQDGVNGYLFKSGDESSFSHVLMRALTNSTEREVIGNNAFQTIYKSEYLWEKNAEKTLNLLSKTSCN